MSGPDSAAPDVDTPSTPHESEPVGSVAQEAFKLLRAVTAQGVGASTGDDRPSHDQAAQDHAAHDHVCSTTWCPVCQVVGFVRDNPDAIASVKRSATDLARSLRDLVDTALAPEEKK
ncbi:hypothetical protein [Aeromicrobium fastidiosum]|uniref:Uncharacterized protein n=1 Tax=Aeromicrobium fastidiosum TaxID=52699 RepID=A0A641AP57_9ACTN|nr:hypothetical protein [Aeromicrobium fastidiosum]KAA1378656.1 hypothetical protein ESP62_009975 [Aeromicrobium fastidiosum]MBP2392361.1 hypothetical protein [Aeromicrobium fastidiosum]